MNFLVKFNLGVFKVRNDKQSQKVCNNSKVIWCHPFLIWEPSSLCYIKPLLQPGDVTETTSMVVKTPHLLPVTSVKKWTNKVTQLSAISIKKQCLKGGEENLSWVLHAGKINYDTVWVNPLSFFFLCARAKVWWQLCLWLLMAGSGGQTWNIGESESFQSPCLLTRFIE